MPATPDPTAAAFLAELTARGAPTPSRRPAPATSVQKAVGGALREAGTKDRGRLLAFLDDHAAAMPRVALRHAIEHLEPGERKRYLDIPRIRP